MFVALAWVVAAPAPASAAVTSNFASNTLTVTGDGADDTAVVTCEGTAVKVNGANPDSGSQQCTGSTASTQLREIVINGNSGADLLEVVSPPGQSEYGALGAVTIDGGEGADEVRGSFLGSTNFVGTLLGGAGDDVVVNLQYKIARGGPGDDRLVGLGSPNQTFDGGEGSDEAFVDISTGNQTQLTLVVEDSGVSAQFEGQPEPGFLPWTSIERFDALLNDGRQTVDAAGFAGTVRVNGLGGEDTLTGGAGPDALSGGAGNDVLEGAGGPDELFGDSGDDLLRARDDTADSGDCGPGADSLIADRIDVIAACETVDVPPPPRLDGVGVNAAWRVRRARTRITRLRVVDVVPETVVEVRCSGESCPFDRKQTSKARDGVINALALFPERARKRLRAGQTVEVRVTAPGHVGKVVRFRLRKGKKPKRTTLCLPVGATTPRASC